MLEGSGTYVQQQLRGLRRGSVDELRLRMANRPGYGDDETVVIKLDNHEIGESNHPSDDFSEYGVAFTARTSNPVLRIENNTPNEEDCSVFIDEVTVTSVQLGGESSNGRPSYLTRLSDATCQQPPSRSPTAASTRRPCPATTATAT